jgi:hypothetical protein
MKMCCQFVVGTEAGGKLLTRAKNDSSPVPAASRRALLLPGINFRNTESFPAWSFKHPLVMTLSAPLRIFFDFGVTRLKLKKDRDSSRRLVLSIGGMADENFDPVQAARAAKWPGFF